LVASGICLGSVILLTVVDKSLYLHYNSERDAVKKAKTITNNLPWLSVLVVVIY